MKAYVLLEVPALRSGGVAKLLRRMPAVKVAWALYGDVDIIAEVEVSDSHELDQLVMKEMQDVREVQSTRTYIVVEDEALYK